MPRIIAIEPDPERGRALSRLVRDRVEAEFELAQTTDEAIAAISAQPADLILTSVLLPTREDSQLVAHLKQHDQGGNVPVLIVPPALNDEAVPVARRWWSPWRAKRQTANWPPYDANVVAARILDALSEETLPETDEEYVPLGIDRTSSVSGLPNQTSTALVLSQRQPGEARYRRFRAERWDAKDLAWLNSVTLSWGVEVRLVNLSTSGLLIESRFKFAPGQQVEFQLWGWTVNRQRDHQRSATRRFNVRGRIVRTVSEPGVRCQAAAAFQTTLGLPAYRR
jgi:CheY-like chemotaxis protein